MTLAQLFPKQTPALPLDATEPRLEAELSGTDNIMAAVVGGGGGSSSDQGNQDFHVFAEADGAGFSF